MVALVRTIREGSSDDAEPPERRHPDVVLLIYSTVDGLEHSVAEESIADHETEQTAHAIAEALEMLNIQVREMAVNSIEDVAVATEGLDPQSTLVFNMVEELPGRLDGESAVLRPLEELGFAYLGATPRTLDECRDKAYCKELLAARGIPVAPSQVFVTGDEPLDPTLPLPAIIKPTLEDSSAGITRESVVYTETALRERVKFVIEKYRQPVMAEMFLDGREFNVSVWGNDPPITLPLAETDYNGWEQADMRVLNFDSKWTVGSFEYTNFTVACPAQIESKADRQIRSLALKVYKLMGGSDFMRVDMREKNGQMYILDINPNPCLAHDDVGFVHAARVAGYDYGHMLRQLVEWGWRRTLKSRERRRGNRRMVA